MIKIDSVEKQVLLEGIYLKYGYDFRRYSEMSMHRRLQSVMVRYQIKDTLEFLKRILREPNFFQEVLPYFTISTTELFRDPEVFCRIRQTIVPILKTYPTLNIWIAGCSTGEEVYSIAILLREEGLLQRSTVFATDINPVSLRKAREGIYNLETIKTFTKNYTAAGGIHSPSEYYTAEYNLARFDPRLRENIVFSEHNLATDEVFCEMHLILCRNVLIYFNRNLQDRALDLFSRSLIHRGFLVLGTKETAKFSSAGKILKAVDMESRIFQKSEYVEVLTGELR